MTEDVDKFWKKVAKRILKAGAVPIPCNDTILELTKVLITEEEGRFIINFRKPTLTFEQIKNYSKMDEKSIYTMLDGLMKKGIIIESMSRSAGVIIYGLMSYMPGIFEFAFMTGKKTEREIKLAHLYEKLYSELEDFVQGSYDQVVSMYKTAKFSDRVIPVEKYIDVEAEKVVPLEEIEKLVDVYDEGEIALANCYCRHEKEILGKPCKVSSTKLNCFQIGKGAVFAIKHGFGKSVSKQETMKILREAEEIGLVHKVTHVNMDASRPEMAICSCCKCCCDNFQLYKRGVNPIKTLTSYVCVVNAEDCIGCGNCSDVCPIDTPLVVNDVASVDIKKCMGCGVCTNQCPQEAMILERTGPRYIFIPPIKTSQN
ncbi:MAG: 4Fe-4S dicluster domain-containing protein [archaeon]|nr:4Fe-4S dicluster domain-containing protein [archaeon]